MVAELETLRGSLEDVRAFCSVYELGSISAAARHLNTTKGGLSRRVSRLEKRLDARLLARTPRAVSPTEEGTAFYRKASEALTLLDEAADGARQSQSIPKGHLRVTAPTDIGVNVLPPVLVEFHALHPQITSELIVSDTALDLAAQRIDLALRATVEGLPNTNYRASAIVGFPIALYATSDYLAARETPVHPADLAGHEIIATRESAGAALWTLTNRRGRSESLTLRAAIRSGNFASTYELIRAGGGIGTLPDLIAAPAVAAGELVRVLPEWIVAQAKLHAITLAGHEAPARVRAFRDFLRERLVAACAAQ